MAGVGTRFRRPPHFCRSSLRGNVPVSSDMGVVTLEHLTITMEKPRI